MDGAGDKIKSRQESNNFLTLSMDHCTAVLHALSYTYCDSLLEISQQLLQPFEIRKINNYMADKGQFYLMQNYAFSPKECTLRNKHQLLPGDVRKQCCKTPLYCH